MTCSCWTASPKGGTQARSSFRTDRTGVGARGFPAKSLGDARDAMTKYLETGKVPKRKKEKKITLESPVEEGDDS